MAARERGQALRANPQSTAISRPFIVENEESTTSGATTAQGKEEQDNFVERVLHPRWISIQRSRSVRSEHNAFRKKVDVAILGDRHTDSANLQPLLGDFWTGFDSEDVVYLHNCSASEAQLEPNVWRVWFLEGSKLNPYSKSSTSHPHIVRIVQAEMILNSRRGGGVLPPLIPATKTEGNPVGLWLKYPGIRTW